MDTYNFITKIQPTEESTHIGTYWGLDVVCEERKRGDRWGCSSVVGRVLTKYV
jgi:hypothetical protein